MRQRMVKTPLWHLSTILALLMAVFSPIPTARGLWTSLTGVLPGYTDFGYNWGFSPDSKHVIYIADVVSDDQYDLYSASLSGGSPVRLNPALVAGGDVQRYAVTPDGQYVIYTADQEVDERIDLYRVPIAGGAAVKLNGMLPAGGTVIDLKVDPDNVHVVYMADAVVNDVYELYSVPIIGGTPVKLSPTPVSGGDIYRFDVDRIANRVVFIGDLATDGRYELYSAPIAGGASVRLSPAGSGDTLSFDLDPSLQVVVFSATPSGSTSTQLYMNATTGGLLTTLNFPLASNQDVFGYGISPNGARVVYNVTTMTSTLFVTSGNLHSVLIGGGASTQLTWAAANGYGVYGGTFSITDDNQRVVYAYQSSASAQTILQSVPITGGTPTTLYTPGSGQALFMNVVSPDGQWVVYNSSPSYAIYAIAVTGGTPIGLGASTGFLITPDSARVLVPTDTFTGKDDLISMQIFGGGQRNLSRIASGEQVRQVVISPDGQSIAYEVHHSGTVRGLEIRISDGGEAQQALYLPSLSR